MEDKIIPVGFDEITILRGSKYIGLWEWDDCDFAGRTAIIKIKNTHLDFKDYKNVWEVGKATVEPLDVDGNPYKGRIKIELEKEETFLFSAPQEEEFMYDEEGGYYSVLNIILDDGTVVLSANVKVVNSIEVEDMDYLLYDKDNAILIYKKLNVLFERYDEFMNIRDSFIDEVVPNATDAYNANHEAKLQEYNDNATSKIEELETIKDDVGKIKDDIQLLESGMTENIEEYNTNHTEKLSEYNTNAEAKTEIIDKKVADFESDFEEKLQEYDDNATTKLQEYNTNHDEKMELINVNLDKKVDKIDGMGLSSNNFTDEYKEKLDDLSAVENIDFLTKSNSGSITISLPGQTGKTANISLDKIIDGDDKYNNENGFVIQNDAKYDFTLNYTGNTDGVFNNITFNLLVNEINITQFTIDAVGATNDYTSVNRVNLLANDIITFSVTAMSNSLSNNITFDEDTIKIKIETVSILNEVVEKLSTIEVELNSIEEKLSNIEPSLNPENFNTIEGQSIIVEDGGTSTDIVIPLKTINGIDIKGDGNLDIDVLTPLSTMAIRYYNPNISQDTAIIFSPVLDTLIPAFNKSTDTTISTLGDENFYDDDNTKLRLIADRTYNIKATQISSPNNNDIIMIDCNIYRSSDDTLVVSPRSSINPAGDVSTTSWSLMPIDYTITPDEDYYIQFKVSQNDNNLTDNISFDVSITEYSPDMVGAVDLNNLSTLSSPILGDEVLTEFRHPITKKPYYSASITFNTTGSAASIAVAHNAPNVENIEVDVAKSYNYNIGGTPPNIDIHSISFYGSSTNFMRYYVSATNFIVQYGSGATNRTMVVVLRYTKTTDTADSPVRLVGNSKKVYTIDKEIQTNDVWIDGKTIYRKAVELPSFDSSTVTATLFSSIDEINTVLGFDDKYSYIKDISGKKYSLNNGIISGEQYYETSITDDDISIATSKDLTGYTGIIIVLYTKI